MSSQRRQFWVILVVVFLGFIGISMPYLVFPALFLNPEFSILPASWAESSRALFLGITLAAYPLGQFIGSPILGALSDDYGRKRLMNGSLVISGVGNLLTAIAIAKGNVTLLIVSRFVAGLMEGNIAIARAMAADLKTLSKHSTFGKINAMISIGYLLGPLLGGLMTDKTIWDKLGPATPFYFCTALFFAIALLGSLVLSESRITTERVVKTVWQRINIVKRMAVLFDNRQLMFLMIVSTTYTLAADIFFEFAPVYLTLKWTLVPSQLIIYNIFLCMALAVSGAWLSKYLADRFSFKSSIVAAMGLFAFSLIGIVLANSTGSMIALFALSGVGIGVAGTLVTVKISDSASDAIQGEVMGVQLSLRVLGDGLICLFGGVLLMLSSWLILVLASLLALVAMVYFLRGK